MRIAAKTAKGGGQDVPTKAVQRSGLDAKEACAGDVLAAWAWGGCARVNTAPAIQRRIIWACLQATDVNVF